MSGFDSFNFAGDERWAAIESNLYFSTNDVAEQQRILNKRRQKWYKANIDPDHIIPDATQSSANTTSSNNNSNSSSTSGSTNSRSSTSSNNSSSSSNSSSVPPQQSYTPPPSASATPSFFRKYSTQISWLQLALHVLILVNVATFTLPLLGVDSQGPSFTRVQVLNLLAQALYMLRQHGMPRLNADYARQLFTDEQAHYFFLSVVLLNASGSLILIAPFAIRSALFIAGGLKQLLPRYAPRVWPVVQGPISKLVAQYGYLTRLNALLEVLAGFSVIIGLLTPARSFMLLIGFWQYLRIRYMLSADSKAAWSSVRGRTDGWMASPRVPAAVRGVYDKVLLLLEQYTDQEALARQQQEAQNAGGLQGMMSKCSVM